MAPTPNNDLTARLKEEARRLGFDLAGGCRAAAPPRIDRFDEWLAAGYAGRMRYLADRAEAYRHPRHVLGGVRSILMLAMNYRTVEPVPPGGGQGAISRYAWGDDYHDLIRRRLDRLADFHRRLTPGANIRGVVDTAPLLEREFAALAGLGWIGKNTMLVNERLGSWLFLAALLTSEPLDCDEPAAADRCGSCRACLDACPTGALVEPYRLDSRRCISYLTIEQRGHVPEGLRSGLGDRLFGCDVCQEVCPWNRDTPGAVEQHFQPGPQRNPIELAELFLLDEAALRKQFRSTPLWRAKREGILRNAAIVLGNRSHEAAAPALMRGLHDAEPTVRAACAWALDRLG
jgi:epoxyqueuosine reductase